MSLVYPLVIEEIGYLIVGINSSPIQMTPKQRLLFTLRNHNVRGRCGVGSQVYMDRALYKCELVLRSL